MNWGILRIVLSILALIAIAWAMASGSISYHGTTMTRADNPVGFWALGAVMAILAIAFLCVGISEQRKKPVVKDDKTDP